MSEQPSYDHQTTTIDMDNVVVAASMPSEQPLTEATEGHDVPQIRHDQPSLYFAPLVQGEDLPLSSVQHSSLPSSYEDTLINHPTAANQSALPPPRSIDLLSPPITTTSDNLPQGAQPPVIVDRTADDSPAPRPGDLPAFRQSDYFLGPSPAFLLSERSSLTGDSLKASATSNNASNEEQPLALAAGGVAGVEPDDKEALGDARSEEPSVSGEKSKGSKRRKLIVLGVLAAILIIAVAVIVPVYFVVVKKKNNVAAATGGSSGSPTATSAKPTSTGKPVNHGTVRYRSFSDYYSFSDSFFFFFSFVGLTDGRRWLHGDVSQWYDVHIH